MRPLAAIRISFVVALAAGAAVTASLVLHEVPPPPAPVAIAQPPPATVPPPAPADMPIAPAIPIEPPQRLRDCAGAMEANRRALRKDRVVITARYLGAFERFGENGQSTRRHCRPGARVWATVRFALTSPSPWEGSDFTPARLARMRMGLPCPELSRAAYQKLFPDHHHDRDDANGLGSAPALRRGDTYTLTVVRGPDLLEDDQLPDGGEFIWTLIAIDPR